MRHLTVGLVLLVLTLSAYRSVWSAGWVYEDRATLTAATESASWARAVSNWTWRMTPTPRAAHLVNLACHLVIAVLLGLLVRRLGLTTLGMWVVVLAWLLHPLTTETVAYVKARSEQLVLIGALLAMIAAAGRWWRPWGLVGMVGGSVLAVGAEPSGVVVVLLVPLVIWYGRHRYWREVPLWAPWWFPAIIAAELILGGILWYGGLRAVVNADTEAGLAVVTAVTWWQWGLAQSGAVWYWCLAVVWPAFVTPDLDVDRLSGLTRGMGVGLMLAGAVIAVRCHRTRPLVTLALLWTLCAIGPRLLVQTPRSYLNAAQFASAFMGVTLLAGVGAEHLRERWTQHITERGV